MTRLATWPADLDARAAADAWPPHRRKPQRTSGKPLRFRSTLVIRKSSQRRREEAMVRLALEYGTPHEREDAAINRRISESAGEIERVRVEQALREAGGE